MCCQSWTKEKKTYSHTLLRHHISCKIPRETRSCRKPLCRNGSYSLHQHWILFWLGERIELKVSLVQNKYHLALTNIVYWKIQWFHVINYQISIFGKGVSIFNVNIDRLHITEDFTFEDAPSSIHYWVFPILPLIIALLAFEFFYPFVQLNGRQNVN